MTNYNFPEIDTSYWRLDDKEWKVSRKKEWARIEPMLASSKTGKGKTVIKQYFLTGKVPNWEKLREWDNYERHVDVFMFIWLHPSWDETVLTPLRDAYMAYDWIMIDDIQRGFTNFLQWSTVMASQDYTDDDDEEMKHALVTDGHNELLFKVLMGDLQKREYNLELKSRLSDRERQVFKLPQSKLRLIHQMGKWLSVKKMCPINEDMLFQYDQPLEWWYNSCTQDEDYFRKQAQEQAHRAFFKKALYRIHHFNTEKEGDTRRTRFVHKIRKILDEREFISEFTQMWLDVKNGKIEIDDPWVL